MLIFGGLLLASAYATDLNTLVVLRFLTGIGCGRGHAKCNHAIF